MSSSLLALIDFGIRVSQLDGNISDFLVSEPDGMNSRDCFNQCAFSMGDMANRAYVDSGLATDDFERQHREVWNLVVGLLGELGLLLHQKLLLFLG